MGLGGRGEACKVPAARREQNEGHHCVTGRAGAAGWRSGTAGAAGPGRAQCGPDGGAATVEAGGSAPWRRPRPSPPAGIGRCLTVMVARDALWDL